MPRVKKWRVLINGKAIPRRFSSQVIALKEFEKQKSKYEAIDERKN